ncbi:MAG: DUF1343 domain-containing protein [Armatimonadetes bacterium]|nr:DUF1343 domain-containing protein [Armatimonadota bacterium]
MDCGWPALQRAIGGRRVGLVTGPTGWMDGVGHVAETLAEHGLLRALFAPEHGIWGDLQAGVHVADGVDPRCGVPVHSLYGAAARPTVAMLDDIDVVVGCLQDASARPYTFALTLSGCLETCAEAGRPMILLDRPTPLGGTVQSGNVAAGHFARIPLPMRVGLSHGELLRLTAAELGWSVDLTIVPLCAAPRTAWYDETGLMWVLPSPNLPTLDSVLCFGATVLLEGTNASEGRGTTRPFELLGAPWLDGHRLAQELNARSLPGVLARPASFCPTFSKAEGQICGGMQIHITDRHAFDGPRLGLHLIDLMRRIGGEAFEINRGSLAARFDDATLVDALLDGVAPDDLWAAWRGPLATFAERCRAVGIAL